jgi:chemotaxis protein MotB
MRTARWWTLSVCGLLALVAIGCQQDPDKLQLQAQADEINRLTAENTDLRQRLAAAQTELNNLRNRNAQLEQQIRDLRAQLEAQPPVERGPKDWVTSGPYAWVSIGTDFLFDSGKATLRPQARARLQEIVQQIRENFADRDIWVLGHTDSDPIKVTKDLWADNLDLSVNRGMTVFKELQSLGINPNNMIAGGQGQYRPLADNASKAGKQQNRRVEIIAVPHRGTPEGAPAAPAGRATPPANAGGTQEPIIEK